MGERQRKQETAGIEILQYWGFAEGETDRLLAHQPLLLAARGPQGCLIDLFPPLVPVAGPVFTRGGASCSSCLPPVPRPRSFPYSWEGRALGAGIIAPDNL